MGKLYIFQGTFCLNVQLFSRLGVLKKYGNDTARCQVKIKFT